MEQNRKNKLVALLICVGLLAGLAACTGARRQEATFTVAVTQKPDTLNPYTSSGGIAEEFFLMCYDPLWRVGADGQPQACLAEEWSMSSDGLTWTIRIRRDASFSDGKPVTAADVLLSYEIMANSAAYGGYFKGISAVRSPDQHTVVISTEYVKGDMMYNVTPILPAHLWRSYEFSPASFDNAAMVGSGPFIFDQYASGADEWRFRARTDYFGGMAQVSEVCFSAYGTETGAARALAAGEVDASFGLNDVQLTTLEGVPGVRLVEAMLPSAQCCALVYNTREGHLFADGQLRRLIERCADRERFLSMSAGGAGMTGSSFFSPGTNAFVQPDGLRGYDVDGALAELLSMGYYDVDSDGMLEGPDGKDLHLTIYTSSLDTWASTAAVILTTDLEKLGISVDWRKTERPVAEVCTADAVWDICLYGWTGHQNAAAAADDFAADVGQLSGWSDGGFDSAREALRSAGDETAIREQARGVQQLVYDACPVVVLAYSTDVQAIRNDAWTGYESALEQTGGLFGTGCVETYMSVEPLPPEAAPQ